VHEVVLRRAHAVVEIHVAPVDVGLPPEHEAERRQAAVVQEGLEELRALAHHVDGDVIHRRRVQPRLREEVIEGDAPDRCLLDVAQHRRPLLLGVARVAPAPPELVAVVRDERLPARGGEVREGGLQQRERPEQPPRERIEGRGLVAVKAHRCTDHVELARKRLARPLVLHAQVPPRLPEPERRGLHDDLVGGPLQQAREAFVVLAVAPCSEVHDVGAPALRDDGGEYVAQVLLVLRHESAVHVGVEVAALPERRVARYCDTERSSDPRPNMAESVPSALQ